MHEVDVRYTKPLVRAAVRAFYWRTLRRRFGWSGLAALLVTACALGFLVLAGDRSWLVGFAGACLLIVMLILALGYVAHLRASTARFTRMAEPQAHFVFREDGLTVSSDAGTATLPWPSLREVWTFPKFWLFLLSPSSFFTLPTEGIGEDVLAFIRSKTDVA